LFSRKGFLCILSKGGRLCRIPLILNSSRVAILTVSLTFNNSVHQSRRRSPSTNPHHKRRCVSLQLSPHELHRPARLQQLSCSYACCKIEDKRNGTAMGRRPLVRRLLLRMRNSARLVALSKRFRSILPNPFPPKLPQRPQISSLKKRLKNAPRWAQNPQDIGLAMGYYEACSVDMHSEGKGNMPK